MSFNVLNTGLHKVAEHALTFCKKRYGGNGLKIEEGIASEISWRPTFFLRPEKFRIVAVEVDDKLYPEALKGGAFEISNYDGAPISVFQVCSLNAYQNDKKQTMIHSLLNHGFGIMTVDDDGKVTVQHNCIPLAQHISSGQLESALASLNKQLKIKFKDAHDTYRTNEGQGLQQTGQIIEALIASFASQALKSGKITNSEAQPPLSSIIDALYNRFKDHRAALGDARAFIKEFRNTASHPQHSAKQASDKIKKCKTGFLDAINIATKLQAAMKKLGYKVKIYTS